MPTEYITEYIVLITPDKRIAYRTECIGAYQSYGSALLNINLGQIYPNAANLLDAHQGHIDYINQLLQTPKEGFHFENYSTFSYEYSWHRELQIECDLNDLHMELFGFKNSISLQDFLGIQLDIKQFLERVKNDYSIKDLIKNSWHLVDTSATHFIYKIPINAHKDHLQVFLTESDMKLSADEFIASLTPNGLSIL